MPYSDLEIDGFFARDRIVSLAMIHTARPEGPGAPGCWFGGEPNLPPEIEWPSYRNEQIDADIPLHFILQMDLRSVPRVLSLPRLPESGTLFLFYDPSMAQTDEEMDETYYPMQKGQACRVIYVAEDVCQYPPRKGPPMPDIESLVAAKGDGIEDERFREYMARKNSGFVMPNGIVDEYLGMRDMHGVKTPSSLWRWHFDFLVFDTYRRTWQDHHPANQKGVIEKLNALHENLSDGLQNYRAYDEYHEDHSPHSMFGAPKMSYLPTAERMNNDMRQKDVPPLSDDHVMLFHLNGQDDRIHFWTQGSHFLSFWIHKDDLAERNFDKVTCLGGLRIMTNEFIWKKLEKASVGCAFMCTHSRTIGYRGDMTNMANHVPH